jgi:hypothetical protein
MIDKKTKKASSEKEFNISLSNIELYSINGQQLKCDLTKGPFQLTRNNFLDIHGLEGNLLKIKLSEKLFFKPEGPFKLDLDIIGTYEIDENTLKEDIEKVLEDLAQPLFSYASLIIAIMTEKFASLPIIVPPVKSEETD